MLTVRIREKISAKKSDMLMRLSFSSSARLSYHNFNLNSDTHKGRQIAHAKHFRFYVKGVGCGVKVVELLR